MNKGTGSLVAVILAVSLLTQPGSPPGRQPPGEKSGGAKPEPPLTAISPPDISFTISPLCRDPDRIYPARFLVSAISDFYGSEAPSQRRSRKQKSGTWDSTAHCGVPENAHITFVIATLPDPPHTHLSLWFDRGIDAIQEAAQEMGYVFNRAAMPWNDREPPESTDYRLRFQQQRFDEGKEDVPGIMIFRRRNPGEQDRKKTEEERMDALFVLVVGETPTGGIRKHQFATALELIRVINPKIQELSILGPMFSGSLYSLHDLLQPSLKTLFPNVTVAIRSGTITSWSASKWFQRIYATSSQRDSLLPKTTFITFQESDDYAICRFLGYLGTHNYGAESVALLSEDETAYGGFARNPDAKNASCDEKVVHLYFPREISQLRAAYQRDVLSELPADTGSAHQRYTLRLRVEDSGSDEDSVPSYSHSQTPLSQESVILGITTELQAHHVKFVVIRATDPMDQLFLARYLRVGYPPGRIVTIGADLLFRREIEDNLLQGTLAIAPYPLLPRLADKIYVPKDSHTDDTDRVFPSSFMAGLYNAMISVLAGTVPNYSPCEPAADKQCDRDADLNPAPYAGFGWRNLGGDPAGNPDGHCQLSPTLYLDVLGHDGYWPLALLDSYKTHKWPPSNLHAIAGSARAPKKEVSVPTVWKLFCGICLVLVLIYIYLLDRGSVFSTSDLVATFSPVPDPCRSSLLLIGELLLIVLLLLILCPWIRWGMSFSDFPSWISILGASAIALTIFSAYDLDQRGSRKHAIALLVVTVCAAITAIWVAHYGSDAHANVLLYRYVHLESGVSPLLPIALLLATGLWWVWYSLVGLAFLDRRRPRLPSAFRLTLGNSRDFYISAQGNRSLIRVMRPTQFDWRVYVPPALVILVAGVSIGWNHPVQTVEGQGFELSYTFGFALIAFVMLCTLMRLTVTWAECRRLLAALDRLPLRRGFRRLSGFSWKPLWRLGGTALRDSYQLISREMESLNHFQESMWSGEIPEGVSQPAKTGNAIRKQLESIFNCKKPPGDVYSPAVNKKLARLLMRHQSHIATACAAVINFLNEKWQTETSPAITESKKEDKSAEYADIEDRKVAEEFVCLVYLNFILTVLLRMRSMIMTVGGMYVLLLLSLSSYPFEPRLPLRSLVIALFLLIGAFVVVIYAQMHRDATLSHITDTEPGELGLDFWIRIATFGVVPLLSLLASQFPGISNVMFSRLQPMLEALK